MLHSYIFLMLNLTTCFLSYFFGNDNEEEQTKTAPPAKKTPSSGKTASSSKKASSGKKAKTPPKKETLTTPEDDSKQKTPTGENSAIPVAPTPAKAQEPISPPTPATPSGDSEKPTITVEEPGDAVVNEESHEEVIIKKEVSEVKEEPKKPEPEKDEPVAPEVDDSPDSQDSPDSKDSSKSGEPKNSDGKKIIGMPVWLFGCLIGIVALLVIASLGFLAMGMSAKSKITT